MDVREKLMELVKLAGVRDKGVALRIADCLVVNGVTLQELDGCDFCKKFDFAGAKAEVNKYGAHISLMTCNTKLHNDEQFKFCPMCGRRLPQPLKGE